MTIVDDILHMLGKRKGQERQEWKMVESGERCALGHPLLSINTQLYCEECSQMVAQVEADVRSVPLGYGSNNACLTTRRLESFVREFLNKYRLVESREELSRLVNSALLLPGRGAREAAAVVVYLECKEQHCLTIRKYCQTHSLSLKAFNAKYLLHCKSHPPLHTAQQQENTPPQHKQQQRMMRAVLSVYDQLFLDHYFAVQKRQVCQCLVKRMKDAQQKLDCSDEFYLLFAVLRQSKHISIAIYCNIVQSVTGVILQKRRLGMIKRAYKQEYNGEEDRDTISQEAPTQHQLE